MYTCMHVFVQNMGAWITSSQPLGNWTSIHHIHVLHYISIVCFAKVEHDPFSQDPYNEPTIHEFK